MTEKQKRFANEYIIDLNATRAYKATYPKVKSDSTASVNASKLLRNAKVKAYIEELMKERAKRTEISQDDVIKELCKIGFSKITDFVVIENGVVRVKSTDEMPEEKIGAIAGIKEGQNGIEIKMNDKVKSLELLGKHLGMFKEKVQVEGSAFIKIFDDIESVEKDD